MSWIVAATFASFLIGEPACIGVDAGHGGPRDDGTTSLELHEKHLTLQLAKKLALHLKAMLPNYNVVLTREDDRDVPLTERAKIVNQAKCALLVSLHVNGSTRPRAHGIETYYLDTMKNRLSRRLLDLAKKDGKATDTPSLIARELEVRARAQHSGELASRVQQQTVQNLASYADVKSNGTHYDLFQLLLSAEMPAVIVETGYLSNPMERTRLATDSYQTALTKGIATGVKQFLSEAPY